MIGIILKYLNLLKNAISKLNKKLKIMQKKYLNFHNEKNFNLIMSRIIN